MFQRPAYLQRLIDFKDTDFIKVITGVRRSGKSVLLLLFKEYLKQENIPDDHIIYMNFEILKYQTITTEEKLQEKFHEKLPKYGEKFICC